LTFDIESYFIKPEVLLLKVQDWCSATSLRHSD